MAEREEAVVICERKQDDWCDPTYAQTDPSRRILDAVAWAAEEFLRCCRIEGQIDLDSASKPPPTLFGITVLQEWSALPAGKRWAAFKDVFAHLRAPTTAKHAANSAASEATAGEGKRRREPEIVETDDDLMELRRLVNQTIK